jgi:hypothetical protein
MEKPFLYRGSEPLEISAEVVFDVVKTIIASGQEINFIREANERKATITASPEVVNLIKNYLFDKAVFKTEASAKAIINSARCDPPAG